MCTVVKHDLIAKERKRSFIIDEDNEASDDAVTNRYMEVIAVWELMVAHRLQVDGFQSDVDVH